MPALESTHSLVNKLTVNSNFPEIILNYEYELFSCSLHKVFLGHIVLTSAV